MWVYQAIRANVQGGVGEDEKAGAKDSQYCPYFKELNYILKECAQRPEFQPLSLPVIGGRSVEGE